MSANVELCNSFAERSRQLLVLAKSRWHFSAGSNRTFGISDASDICELWLPFPSNCVFILVRRACLLLSSGT